MELLVEGKRVRLGMTRDVYELASQEGEEFTRKVMKVLHEKRKQIRGRNPLTEVQDARLRDLRQVLSVH